MNHRLTGALFTLLAIATCAYFFARETDERSTADISVNSINPSRPISVPVARKTAPGDRIKNLKQVDMVASQNGVLDKRNIPVGVCAVIHDSEGNAEATCNLGTPEKTELISPFRPQ